MSDPAVTPELIAKYGITPDEYLRIEEMLGPARHGGDTAVGEAAYTL